MLKIAVCDDDDVALNCICKYIRIAFDKYKEEIVIYKYTDGALLLQDNIYEKFDVFFLDIQMPDIDGFEVAKKLRELSPKAQIIFITSNSQLVFQSFDYQPFHFIEKGSGDNVKNDIIKVVGIFRNKLNLKAKIVLGRPFTEQTAVAVNDIIYIESDGHYLIYHIKDSKSIKTRGMIENAAEKVEQYDFIRIHRQYLVNLALVKSIRKSNNKIVLTDNTELDIGGSYKNCVCEKYVEYMRRYDI